MVLKDNERLDEVNDSLSLIQKTDGLTFGTDALLLAGYVSGKYKLGCELGGLAEVTAPYTDFRTGKPARVPAIRMLLK